LDRCSSHPRNICCEYRQRWAHLFHEFFRTERTIIL
jgi:hypothetical protein